MNGGEAEAWRQAIFAERDRREEGQFAGRFAEAGGPHTPTGGFWAKIVQEGPEGEEDWDNGWYWVRQQEITFGDEGDAPEIEDKEDGRHVAAYCLDEYGMGDDHGGIHALLAVPTRESTPAPQLVWVFRMRKAWVFSVAPFYRLKDSYYYDARSIDANDCVDAYTCFHGYIAIAVMETKLPPQ